MTSILAVLKDKVDGLAAWRKRVGEEEADRITKEAGQRGNELHDLSEKYLNNELKRSEVKGQAGILFNRAKRHLDTVQAVIATEVPLYSTKCKYAGRVDAVVMMGNQLTILDHKNSRNPIDLSKDYNRRKLFKYQLQCAGYARAFHEMTGIKPTQGCLIVSNFLASTSDIFKFDLEPFYKELDLVVEEYYESNGCINKSKYYEL